jgi:hypothetical protein
VLIRGKVLFFSQEIGEYFPVILEAFVDQYSAFTSRKGTHGRTD